MSLDLTSGKKRLISSSAETYYIIDSARNETIQASTLSALSTALIDYLQTYYLSEDQWISNTISTISSAFGSYYQNCELDQSKGTQTGSSSEELVITYYGYYIFTFGYDTAGASVYEYDYSLNCSSTDYPELTDSVFVYALETEGSDIVNKGGVAGTLTTETTSAYLDGFTFSVKLSTIYDGEPFIPSTEDEPIFYTTDGVSEMLSSSGTVLVNAEKFLTSSSIKDRLIHDDGLLYNDIFVNGITNNSFTLSGFRHYLNISLVDGEGTNPDTDVYLASNSYALQESGYYPTSTGSSGLITNMVLQDTTTYESGEKLYHYYFGKNSIGTHGTNIYFFSHDYITNGQVEHVEVPCVISPIRDFTPFEQYSDWLEDSPNGTYHTNSNTIMDLYVKNGESLAKDNWILRLTLIGGWNMYVKDDVTPPSNEFSVFEEFVNKWGAEIESSSLGKMGYDIPWHSTIVYIVPSSNGYSTYSIAAVYDETQFETAGDLSSANIKFKLRENNNWSARPSLNNYTFLARRRSSSSPGGDTEGMRDYEEHCVNGYLGDSMDSLL